MTSLPSPSSSSTEEATTQVSVSCQALVQVSLQEFRMLFVNDILHVVLQAPSTGVFVPQGFVAGSQFNRIFGPGGPFAQVFGRRK